MPTSYVIYKEEGLVISTASGRVTFEEIQAHREGLLNDSDFNPNFDQLIKFLPAEAPDLSSDEVRQLAQQKMFSATSRRALVATNPATFGLSRMFQIFAEFDLTELQIAVFRDLASALTWLGREGLSSNNLIA